MSSRPTPAPTEPSPVEARPARPERAPTESAGSVNRLFADCRPSRQDLERARARADATITWSPGAVPRDVVRFLADAAFDRDALVAELEAVERELEETRVLARAAQAAAARRHAAHISVRTHTVRFGAGLISGILLTLGSLLVPGPLAP